MRTHYSYGLVIMIIIIIISACDKDEIQPGGQPGYFVLSELKQDGLNSSTLETNLKSSDSDFHLGTLKVSKEFLFLLTNGGDNQIFEITLVTDNEAFQISPDHIAALNGNIGTANPGNSALIPILTLGVVHGLQLNGIGYTNLLNMGSNQSTLKITGKTLDNGDTTSISSEFLFDVDAAIMDISMSLNSEEIDLTKWNGTVASNLGGLGFIRYYKINHDNIQIENTGSVEISVNYGEDDNQINLNQSTLEPGANQSINIDDSFLFFVLDGNGTISYPDRIQLGNDGKGYFAIHKTNEEPSDTTNLNF